MEYPCSPAFFDVRSFCLLSLNLPVSRACACKQHAQGSLPGTLCLPQKAKLGHTTHCSIYAAVWEFVTLVQNVLVEDSGCYIALQ